MSKGDKKIKKTDYTGKWFTQVSDLSGFTVLTTERTCFLAVYCLLPNGFWQEGIYTMS